MDSQSRQPVKDGLGEFILGPSDENGVIDASLMQGDWTLSLNRTDINVRWILDNTTISIVSGSGNAELNLTLNKWVEIAGNLFRDLDGNGMWSGMNPLQTPTWSSVVIRSDPST